MYSSSHLFIWKILAYFVGTLTSEFYPILSSKQREDFFIQLARASILVIAMAALITVQNYILKLTQIQWRLAFTSELHKVYFNDHHFYKVRTLVAFLHSYRRYSAITMAELSFGSRRSLIGGGYHGGHYWKSGSQANNTFANHKRINEGQLFGVRYFQSGSAYYSGSESVLHQFLRDLPRPLHQPFQHRVNHLT